MTPRPLLFYDPVWGSGRILLALGALLLAGCSSLVQTLANQECALDPEQPYDVVAVDPDSLTLRLFWRDATGSPYRSFDAVQRWAAAHGYEVIALTNGGIYEPGLIPTGLYVEDGATLQPLNRDDGRGNFFLKPNGVFGLRADSAFVLSADAFARQAPPVDWATQSGPLLVADGVIHPAFNPASSNCRLRSGVGVAPDGTVYLAISNGAVTFYDFATFFREALGCQDALYLDGGISRLYAPSLGRTDTGGPFAVMLAVLAPADP